MQHATASLIALTSLVSTGLAVVGPASTAESGSHRVARPAAPNTTIVVHGRRVEGAVRPTLMGVNHHYNKNGYRLWDPELDEAVPAVVSGTQRAGVESVRFPGGTVANLYDWKRAIGDDRACQVDGNGSARTGFPPVRGATSWGSDEYMEFLAATDARPFIMVPFVTETPRDAASWVEYMNTPAGTPANPGGGVDWADVRAANGHPAPYGIRRWEIGNEQHHAGSRYWMSADSSEAVRQYAFGGYRDVVEEPMGANCRHPRRGVPSDGSAGQTRHVVYPPVAPASFQLSVGGQAWQRVVDLDDAEPDAHVYELSPTTGEVRFGDGLHGAVPPAGDRLLASYRSVHDGYVEFAQAMHAVDPDIDVCASWGRLDFVELMGQRRYDCLTTHSIVPFGEAHWADALEGHDRQMLALRGKYTGAAELIASMPPATPLLVTEYSFIGGDYAAYPFWPATMGHVAAVASLWVSWLQLGLSWAQGDDLLWANRAVLGPPPDYVFTADAVARRAVHPMYEARGNVLAAEVVGNPVRDTGLGDDLSYPGLAATATRAEDGDVWLLVVNRLPYARLRAQVEVRGVPLSGDLLVREVASAEFTDWNHPGVPPDVRIAKHTGSVRPTSFRHVFPAHSVTVLRLSR